jgi:hypothetical protein
MTKLVVNIGSGPNTKDGDTVRLAFDKINQNFTELYETVDLIGGNTDPTGIYDINISGNVSSKSGDLLIDATTGKLTLTAIPTFSPVMYTFRANFDAAGNLSTLQDLPTNWTYIRSSNLATVTYTGGLRFPRMVSYWGATAAGSYRLRYPTAGYQVIRPTAGLSEFTLNLNSAVTGADNNQHALITVIF